MTATGEGASAPSPIRGRIAKAIQGELNRRPFGPIQCGDYLAGLLADAVIAELGLRMEYENGRVIYLDKPVTKNYSVWQQRIASDFEPYQGE